MYDINDQLHIKEYSEYLQKQFKLTVSQGNKLLSSIKLIPILHKNPPKGRFIIAFPLPSLKPLNLKITSVFKLMYQTVQICSNKFRYFSGVNNFRQF